MSSPFNPKNNELEAIRELEGRFKEDLPASLKEDETLFYRFLKARDFDVDNAETMLRKHIAWRKAYQVDTMLETFTPKEVFVKYIGSSRLGLDKEGNVVMYGPTGKIDIRDFGNSVKMNDYMKHIIWIAERDRKFMNEENMKSGKRAYQAVFIFNLDGLTFANATSKFGIDFCLRLTHLLQDNYPENMKNMFIINAPTFFTVVFGILRKVMSNLMLKKIHVFGENGWKDALLKVIDADVLPAFLGGTRTDPDGDPSCKTFVLQGGPVPPKYFLTNEERYFKDMNEVEKVMVLPDSYHKVLAEVKSCGSVIRWVFETKNKDIRFGLFFQQTENKLENVLPVQRIVTIDGTEKGSFKCQSAGTYVIVFDNSHSWLISKEIRYCVKVEGNDS